MYVAGEQWERLQRLADVQSYCDSHPNMRQCDARDRLGFNQGTFRACVAFEGLVEKGFLEEMQHIMSSPDLWDVLPCASRTKALRCELIILALRSCALMHCMKQANTNYPTKLLVCGDKDGMANVVCQEYAGCKRRMDSGSRAFLDFYRGRLPSDALADLFILRLFTRFENLKTEWRNQRLRRHVLGRSLQCKTCDLSSLNVFILLNVMGEWGKGWWRKPHGDSDKDVGGSDIDADERVHCTTSYECSVSCFFFCMPL